MKVINGRKFIVAVCVDDTIIAHESNADLNWLLGQIGKHYKFHDEGELTWALGMEVGRTPNGHYWIGQQRYIRKMMQLFEPIRKKITTPLQSNLRLDLPVDSPAFDPTTHKRLLGSILHVVLSFRVQRQLISNCIYMCSVFASFANTHKPSHTCNVFTVLASKPTVC